MQKLINSVQNYAWGSKSVLTELYGIANPNNLPMAELWIGAYPKSSSKIEIAGSIRSLREVINENKTNFLGEKVTERFGELPFLFKILCVEQPLSIQVHPNKKASEIGFAKENAKGIPLFAKERNYKDSNHKPELLIALKPFLAMNAFREFSEIAFLLQRVVSAHKSITYFLDQPNSKRLNQLFTSLLKMQGKEKFYALAVLRTILEKEQSEPWKTIRMIAEFYPDDSGLFLPLLLNIVKLNPGEAMFLFSEIPHAYLKGVAMEVMANSDNVLRAGLTSKYVNIPEMITNVKFIPKSSYEFLIQPVKYGSELSFPIPVDDFAFSLHNFDFQEYILSQEGAAILFCIEGKITLIKDKQHLVLQAGESAFISANESPVLVRNTGILARIFNKF